MSTALTTQQQKVLEILGKRAQPDLPGERYGVVSSQIAMDLYGDPYRTRNGRGPGGRPAVASRIARVLADKGLVENFTSPAPIYQQSFRMREAGWNLLEEIVLGMLVKSPFSPDFAEGVSAYVLKRLAHKGQAEQVQSGYWFIKQAGRDRLAPKES